MTESEPRTPRDQESWARPVDRLTTSARTTGVDTVTGRRVSGPVQGFGQMWQKTFKVRLTGASGAPEAVVALGLSDHYREIFRITRLSDYLTIADDPSAPGVPGEANR